MNVLVSEQDQLKMVTSDLDVNTEKNVCKLHKIANYDSVLIISICRN